MFEQIVKALEAARIPCRAKLGTDNSTTIELGFDYPDELANKVWDAVEPLGVDVDVCADASMQTTKVVTIAGGPKRHSSFGRRF